MLSDYYMEDFVKFECNICIIDEVIECYLISGGYDYLFKFVICGIIYYQIFMEEILEKDFGILKYFSYIVLKLLIEKLYYLLIMLFKLDK